MFLPIKMNSVVVVVDNDECVGSWRQMARMHRAHILKGCIPSVGKFVEFMERTSAVRPGVRELLTSLQCAKASGAVHSVVMCTAATDAFGWVSFLRVVLETWLGLGVYDHVIDRRMLETWHAAHRRPAFSSVHNCMVKDMALVRRLCAVGNDCPVVVIDDRPEGVVGDNTFALRVCPYVVPPAPLSEAQAVWGESWTDVCDQDKEVLGTQEPLNVSRCLGALSTCMRRRRVCAY